MARFQPLRIAYAVFAITTVVIGTYLFMMDETNDAHAFWLSNSAQTVLYSDGGAQRGVESLMHLHILGQTCSNCSSVNRTNVTIAVDSHITVGNLSVTGSIPYERFLRERITYLNTDQFVRNLDRFDLRADSDNAVVIVIQVHNRADYLLQLIQSLRVSRGISDALIVFSHDYYSKEVNAVADLVEFCPVLQIFYPYSMQLYPNEFPGEDPRDCPRNVNMQEAKAIGCLNADSPDKYGHYREAHFSQIKHHWFWKVNHVFDHLRITQYFNGLVLLLEEDHYVAPDFLHTLKMMYRLRKRSCESCSIFTLGTYDKTAVFDGISSKVDITTWMSNKHNMGMAFDREAWNRIKKCGEAFCRFDDYNWDWSLGFIGGSCVVNKLKAVVVKSPRIFHLGECGGVHSSKAKVCKSLSDKVAEISSLLTTNQGHLFPDSLTVAGHPYVADRVPKPNGGWGDTRDHNLCIRHMINTGV